MDRINNYKKGELCNGCKHLHIGINVDHNHCDHSNKSHWMEERVNGRQKESCIHFERFEKRWRSAEEQFEIDRRSRFGVN